MRTESEKIWLLQAVDGFKKRFVVISKNFEILAASRSTTDAYPADIVGRKCHQAFFNRSSPCSFCAVAEAGEKNETALRPRSDAGFEIDGRLCNVAYPLYENGRVSAFASLEFEFPSYLSPEGILYRSNTFLRKLLVSAVDAVIAADMKGRILIHNEMASRILGYAAEDALKGIGIRDIYPEKTAFEVMRKLRADDHGGRGHLRAYPVSLLSKNNDLIPVHLNAAIVYDGEREIATIGYFHDMREELRMKEELEKTQLQLLQAEKMASLGMLAAGVAHEINNPVAIMIEEAGWIGDLLEDAVFQQSDKLQELRRALGQIHRQGKRCKQITNKLLGFARKSESNVQALQVNELIEEVASLSRQRARRGRVEMATRLAPDLPVARGSASEIQQVLANLVQNALDAMGDGGGTVTLSSHYTPGWIQVEVADNGSGIPREDMNRVFEPFFTTKRVGEGTGLGLFICYYIMKTMGGTIDLHSAVGIGTTFTIQIPVSEED